MEKNKTNHRVLQVDDMVQIKLFFKSLNLAGLLCQGHDMPDKWLCEVVMLFWICVWKVNSE